MNVNDTVKVKTKPYTNKRAKVVSVDSIDGEQITVSFIGKSKYIHGDVELLASQVELVKKAPKKRKKKTIIHVNQNNIRQNIKLPPEEKKPVITVKTYNTNEYGNIAIIYDKYGEEVARIVNGQDNPLSCGARVWIETTYPVKVE